MMCLMRIRALALDGYKNLSRLKIRLDDITALVALNNFGKSNILSGIDFGISFLKAGNEEKALMMADSDLIPRNVSMVGRNFNYAMELSMELEGQEYIIQYGYQFAWKSSEKMEPEILSEYLKVKLNERGQKFSQLISRNRQDAKYKASEAGRCSSGILVEKRELVLNKLRAYDSLYYAELIKELGGIRIYMENNLDVKSFYQPDPIIRKGLENEMLNAENLPRIIFKLKTENEGNYELLINVYKQLFPAIEDIIVRQYQLGEHTEGRLPEDSPFILANRFYVLYVKDRNLVAPIDFQMMSDGAKRVFMILTKIIISRVSNIALIAIEEPENSVHPGLFKAYISIIHQLLDDCKVIITSHSPYIVSYLNPAWIRVGHSDDSGVAEFFCLKRNAQKRLEREAKEYNSSLGDYLFSLLSDPDDSILEYLEDDPDE